MSCMERYRITNWDHFLEDFQQHWPTDQDTSTVEAFRNGNKRSGQNNDVRPADKEREIARLEGRILGVY